MTSKSLQSSGLPINPAFSTHSTSHSEAGTDEAEMSYAQAAAPHGKEQEKHAHDVPDTLPEIAHSDSGVHSINSLDSSSNSVPSYADQGLESERAAETREEALRVADHTAEEAQEFMQNAESELSRLEKDSGKKYEEFSSEAKQSYAKWKGEASKEYKKAKKEAGVKGREAKAEAKKAGEWADENKDNPVVIGNVVVLSALVAGLGAGAYRLNQQGQFTWKVAGIGAGIIGAFAVADYYVSQFFFKKYPPKN